MRAAFLKLCVLGGLLVVGTWAIRGLADEKPNGDQIKWQADIFASHDVSVETGKPMLILVSSQTCPPCRKLKETTLTDPRLVRYVNTAFVPVQLDFEKDAKIIEILEVEQIPSTIVLSPNADLLGRLVGYASVEDYHEALEKTRRIHSKIESMRQASAKKERQ